MQIEARLNEMGLVLPEPVKLPLGITTSFEWVRVRGNRAFMAGHAALNQDGTPAGPFGKVEQQVSLEEAYQSARQTALAVLASLKRTLGDLDRVTAWLMVNGFVNALPGTIQITNVINGFSDLILELYGQEAGQHARFAVGVAALPVNACVTAAAEVEISA
jgi:enamine deaminase RidA (YjgF/YER057c/UK114 family)